MRIRIMRTSLTFACLLLGLGGPGCGSDTTSGHPPDGSSQTSGTLDPTAFGQKYKFADNEMSGWTQDPTIPFWTGKGTDLESRIDGGNMAYLSRGCLVAMYQDLVEGDQAACEIVAMDLGTEANAVSMVAYEQQLRSASIAIPGYDASAAIGAAIQGGLTAYAHFGSLYFEVQMQGYADQSTGASVAAQFLQKLQSKSK